MAKQELNSAMDWRELKKELFVPSKISDTYRSQDIFNTKQNQPINTPSKVNIYFINQPPLKANESQIFSVEKSSNPIQKGKKTFNTICTFENYQLKGDVRCRSPNLYRIPDHSSDFFHDVTHKIDENYRSRKIESNFIPKLTAKSPQQMKIDQMYSNQVIDSPRKCTNKLSFQPPNFILVKLEINKAHQKQKSLQQPIPSQRRRRVENQSNIFHSDTMIEPEGIRLKTDGDQAKSPRFIDEEIEKIKRENHNFSEVFGLQFGTRGSVKKVGKEISNDLDWITFDSVRNRLDLKIETPSGTQRTKLLDQASALDNHNQYTSLRPEHIKKENKLSYKQQIVQVSTKGLRDKKKQQDLIQLARQYQYKK